MKIIEYVQMQKHIPSAELGVTATYLWMIRTGKRRVTDDLLCRALRYVSPEELAKILGELPEPEQATVNDIIKVVRRAMYDAQFRELLLSMLEKHLGEYIRSAGRKYVVSGQDLEEFRKAMTIEGRAKDTVWRNMRYLELALARLNWTLSPEDLRELIAEMLEEGEISRARHTVKAVKKFIKTVLMPKDPSLAYALYASVKTIRPSANNKTKLPQLEKLREIANRLPTVESRFYFCLLAETGLRPGEPFLASVDDLDLERGVLRIGKVGETKRAFVAFLRPEFIEWIKAEYLPMRERVVKQLQAAGLGHLADRLIPFDRSRLRSEIKQTARQVLGREFELYELRKFFSTYMVAQGVPESIVNTLQGRAGPREYRVLVEYYWSPTHEELRRWHLQHAPRVCF
ncbi:site-specific integrase [Pyrobaculum aerophilum]|uniref:site-specific integrase n=1 Tax=Pyrobaculum aerophilum TaxID=13773 RepID=UPI002FD922FE